MTDLRPNDVVTLTPPTVPDLLDEADAAIRRVPDLAILNAGERELLGALCSLVDAVRMQEERLRKAGL